MASEHHNSSKTRAYIFAALSIILLALSAWVIWDDEFGLRPWKHYQKEYKSLKHDKLEKEYQAAMQEFRRSGGARRLAMLEQKLAKSEEAFKQKGVHDRYVELNARLDDLHVKLANNQKDLQMTRGQYLETEYYFTKTQKPEYKTKMDALQRQIDGFDRAGKALLEKEGPLKQEIYKITGGMAEVRAEIEAIKKALEDQKEKIANNDKSPIEIKQYMIKDTDKADRCVSCHAGIESSTQVSKKQPFTKHPLGFVYLGHHDPTKFGCTFCHRGQGRATTTIEKAHGNVKHWEEPMLKGDMTQTSCLNCHGDIKNLRGAEKIAGNTELIRKYGCYSCHKIPGYEGMGDVGPELTNVGTKVNYSWAVKWLMDPKKYFSTARMPKFFFSQDQAESIADYLFSMSGTTRHDVDYASATPNEQLVEQGRNLWSQARCNLCHMTNGKGGNHIKVYAPDLSKVGSKANKTWLFNWIKDPNKYFPGTKMPRFRFSDQEINALVEYLVSEYLDDEAEAAYTTPTEIKAASIKKGKDLIQQYGCYGCHKIQGMEMVQVAPSLKTQGVTFLRSDEMREKIGTELSSIGSKPVDLLDFGKLKKTISNDRLSYIKQKLRDPRGFRLGLRMPNFGLSEKEVNELASVLYGFIDSNVPVRFMVPSRQELDRMAGVPSYKFTGDFAKVIADVKCTNCHTIKGIGADYAPDLSLAGSKLQESWIRSFLANPDVIRPLLQQMPKLGLSLSAKPAKITMPKFNLGQQKVEDTNRSDVDVVVNYFQQELVTTEIPKDVPVVAEVGMPEQIGKGKQLYAEKGCVACHQIGSDGGAIGPNLSNVGNRLKPGFIFKHLENPRKFKPDIVEPNYGFSERERIFLTNYLMTLKLTAK
ncbi:MAG: c-type cytochrome [Chlorobiaceae bacterium]|nr:c-type cytochrome [Chlorobiaceae bacterium]NTW74426.1 c-type cytochrome [Chlorobiaceae bacterium]